MNSERSVEPVLSQNVVPAASDANNASRELLDNLEISTHPLMTPQDVERTKQMLQANFTYGSLQFALHRLRMLQESNPNLRPTLQQFSSFLTHYEGRKYLKKSLAEITDENMNLRIEKENDKRCFNAFLKELGIRNNKNNELNGTIVQLVTQNQQITTEKDQITVEKDRIAAERGCIAAERDQFAAERDQIAAEKEQMAKDISKLKAVITEKNTKLGNMMVTMMKKFFEWKMFEL